MIELKKFLANIIDLTIDLVICWPNNWLDNYFKNLFAEIICIDQTASSLIKWLTESSFSQNIF